MSTDTSTSTENRADTLSASAQRGKELFKQHKCLSCHTIDDESKQLAPALEGLFGSNRELEDGSTVIADEGYIKESIQYPGAKVALGFNENMPSYRDLMNDQELQDVTNYIKALR